NEAPQMTTTVEWPSEQRPEATRAKESDLSPVEDERRNNAPPGAGPAGLGSGLRAPNQIAPIFLQAGVRLYSRIENGEIVVGLHARAEGDIVTNQAGL